MKGRKQGEVDLVVRRMRAASMLLGGLMLVPIAWLGGDQDETRAIIEAALAGEYAPIPSLPLHLNPKVERWIAEFRTSRRDEFQALIERSGTFEGMIRAKLRERGMPEELLYLAMIESGFLPIAVSQMSAVGLWQFMDPTARQFGLRVDEYVDERRDPLRATDAALDYLQWLYDRYDSWYLAAAAYNAGPARLDHILERYADGRKGDEDIYWEVLSHLPRETREYVPRLVAAAIVATEAEAFGFDVTRAPAYEYEIVFLPGATPLAKVAESLDVEPKVVRDLNPHLVRGVTPPREIYGVRVPKGGAPVVMASLSQRSIVASAD